MSLGDPLSGRSRRGLRLHGNGYLVQEKDASSSYVVRQVSARDSRNQAIQSQLADGHLSETVAYAHATGQMDAIQVSGPSGTVHGLNYEYDIYGNLEYQATSYAGITGIPGTVYWSQVIIRPPRRTI